MPAPRKDPPELRERAMRLVQETRKEDSELSLMAAVIRVPQRTGVNADTLCGPCKQAAIDAGERPGTTTSEAQRMNMLQDEVRELKRANEILLAASSLRVVEVVFGVRTRPRRRCRSRTTCRRG